MFLPFLLPLLRLIVVNPVKHAHDHHQAAQKVSDLLLAPETQTVIAGFGTDRYREPLFLVGPLGKW